MSATNPLSTRTSGRRWLVALVLAVGLIGLSPTRADAAPQTGITDIGGHFGTTCIVTTNHQARCWGEGSDGQLGNNAFADGAAASVVRNVANTGPLTNVKQIATGATHSCAVLTTGNAVCWGRDDNGALGNGGGNGGIFETPTFVRNATDTANLGGVAQIAAGIHSTCARLTSGQVRCWGTDSNGQNGDGGALAFTNQLPRTVVKDAQGTVLTGATQLTGGGGHYCVRLNTSRAMCWGLNTTGQLGDDSVDNRSFAVNVKNASGVSFLPDVAAVYAGSNTTCARITNGQARCWGEGSSGQLGNNDDVDRMRPAVVRAPAGTDVLRNVTQIAVGNSHTCFRISNGQARCTGEAGPGQLGNPNAGNTQVTRPVVVRNGTNTAALTGVAELSAGTDLTCARLTNGQARCWGSDLNQGLGNGAGNGSQVPVVVQGA